MEIEMGDADVKRASSLLTGLKQGLNADGYDLAVKPTRSGVRIDVVATPAACADCLVPKPIFSQIINAALAADSTFDGIHIDVHYPGDRSDSDAWDNQAHS